MFRRSHRVPSVLIVALLSAGVISGASSVRADEAKTEEKPALTATQQARYTQLWKTQWKILRSKFVRVGEEYYPVFAWDAKYKNSRVVEGRRVTEKDYLKSPLVQDTINDQGSKRQRTIARPKEEAWAAASALPEVTPGAYGWVLGGVVSEIVGEQEMILRNVTVIDASNIEDEKREATKKVAIAVRAKREELKKLVRTITQGPMGRRGAPAKSGIDIENIISTFIKNEREALEWNYAERTQLNRKMSSEKLARYTFRAIGYKTSKIKQGEQWPSGDKGVQWMVLSVKNNEVLVIPASLAKSNLSESQVKEALAQFGVDSNAYVDIVIDCKRESYKDFPPLVCDKIEAIAYGKEIDEPEEEDKDKDKEAETKEKDNGGDVEIGTLGD